MNFEDEKTLTEARDGYYQWRDDSATRQRTEEASARCDGEVLAQFE